MAGKVIYERLTSDRCANLLAVLFRRCDDNVVLRPPTYISYGGGSVVVDELERIADERRRALGSGHLEAPEDG